MLSVRLFFRQGEHWLPFVLALFISILLHCALFWGLEGSVAWGARTSLTSGALGTSRRIEARIAPPRVQNPEIPISPHVGVSANVIEPAYAGSLLDIFSNSGAVKRVWVDEAPSLQKYVAPQSERSRFLSPEELERSAFTVSAPDLTLLSDTRPVGSLLGLRVFIDQFGQVVDVQVLSAAEGDELFVARAKDMLYATRFMPGRKKGQDVSSYKDVEILLTDN